MQKNKNWILFLISQGITLFGSSIVQFAIIWYVTLKTSSGLWVSILTVSAYLPQFLISFASGVWADRFSRRKLIIASDSGIALITILFALLFPLIGTSSIILILLSILSALRSIGTGIQTPSTNAVIPSIVPEGRVMKVNGYNATIQSIVQFASPPSLGFY